MLLTSTILQNRNYLIAPLMSLVCGISGTAVIASSENGYVAGFVVFPIFLLFLLISAVLVVAGLVMLAAKSGPKVGISLLCGVAFIWVGFLGSALVAKRFELGAYRVDEMRPMIPEIANKVIFNKEVTDDQVMSFLDSTISTKKIPDLGPFLE